MSAWFIVFVVASFATIEVLAFSFPNPYISDAFAIYCQGNCDNAVSPKTSAAQGLFGGHMYPGVNTTMDAMPYRWMLKHANGGDLVVMTSDPESADPSKNCDLYNPFMLYLAAQDIPLNSVTTICFYNRTASFSSQVAEVLDEADGFFFTGGDQHKYHHFWNKSPVQAAINRLALRGAPFFGSSAGLAIQGQFVFDAEHGGISSHSALQDPFESEITLVNNFLTLYHMRHTITDTHFIQRQRMGRLLAFLARLQYSTDWTNGEAVHGVACSEHTAVLVDGQTGLGYFMGVGPAYFLSLPPYSNSTRRSNSMQYDQEREKKQYKNQQKDTGLPDGVVCESGEPLSLPSTSLWRWSGDDAGAVFDFNHFQPVDASFFEQYTVKVVKGEVTSSQKGGSIY